MCIYNQALFGIASLFPLSIIIPNPNKLTESAIVKSMFYVMYLPGTHVQLQCNGSNLIGHNIERVDIDIDSGSEPVRVLLFSKKEKVHIMNHFKSGMYRIA